MEKTENRKSLKRDTKRLLFYIAIVALPVLQYFFFCIYVKIDSLIMAFKNYELGKGGYVSSFTWQNFEWAWDVFIHGGEMISLSLIVMAAKLLITIGGGLFFSYYAAKKYAWSGFFRITLYLPQMFGSVVFVILYQELLTGAYISISGEKIGLLSRDKTTTFLLILFYNLWVGFGANVMVFSTSMSGVSESVVEAARLDGASPVREFIHVYIPAVFPTCVTYIVAQIAGVFTDGLSLYTFFTNDLGSDIPVVFGHYFYVKTVKADLTGTEVTYPNLSALGIIFSIVLTAIILPLRKYMLKYGPSED